MSDATSYRLPRTVVPSRYELTFTPDLAGARFTGEAKVRVTITETTSTIKLNSIELAIFDAVLVSDDGERVEGAVSLDERSEVATISLGSPVSVGTYTLNMTFAGTLNDQLRGFYRSTFTADDGEQKVIATTKFEATDARRAFPCWDEPDFKAVFAITLIIDDGLTALSNSNVLEVTDLDHGRRQVEFADTIPMSTYLVAFIVGPLDVTEPMDVDGVALRVACVPGRLGLSGFALEAGAASLRFFTDYFGIRYPSDKLDLIAIPDFAAGAMENFGCVTFRETALLVDTDRASRAQVERVAEVVGHEIAHMWFGDLVTMKWWNGLWLNEAFANFMESLFVDDFKPEWGRWASVGVGKFGAMGIDALKTTRPIEFEVRSPEEAEEMFDVLTYYKGGAVLRMLEQHLGPEVFRRGVSAYLKAHEYGNAETTDLWDALDAVSEEPVRALMDTWIFQAGHPTIDASLDGRIVTLTQERNFLLSSVPDDGTLWNVPIGIRGGAGDEVFEQKLLLSGRSTEVELPQDPDWLVVNAGASGFFPVRYSPELLHRVTQNVEHLDELERFALVGDTWNDCLAGRTALRDVLQMVELMTDDDDPNVWRNLLLPLRAMDHLVSESARPALEALVLRVTQTAFDRLGWEPAPGESEQAATSRGLILNARGALGADAATRTEAAGRFAAYLHDYSGLDFNLVGAVQAVLAATNERTHYDTLRAVALDHSRPPQETITALQSLGLFTDPELVNETLSLMITDKVRSQDAPFIIMTMLTRHESGEFVWRWIESHWEELLDRFPNSTIDRMVGGLAHRYEPALLDRADAFLEAHPVAHAAKSIAQTRERMAINKAFRDRNVDGVDVLL